MAIKLHSAFAVHTGSWLRDELITPRDITVTTLAKALGVTRQAASNLLNANAGLSAEMAIRFEKLFGISADTLMRMQARYDLSQARAHEDDIKVSELAA